MKIHDTINTLIQPAVDVGYEADIAVGPHVIGIALMHRSLPQITIWGTEHVDVITADDLRDFTSFADALAFAKGAKK